MIRSLMISPACELFEIESDESFIVESDNEYDIQINYY